MKSFHITYQSRDFIKDFEGVVKSNPQLYLFLIFFMKNNVYKAIVSVYKKKFKVGGGRF